MPSRLAAACASAAIVDTRTPASYVSAHLCGSSSFPLAELPERSGELPPATAGGVWVLAEADELTASLAFLGGGGGGAKAAGWRILGSLTSTAALWDAAAAAGLVERGAVSRRLWSPSPHLPRVASLLESAEAVAG
eukprot:CAMPEP_0202776164 /NCGR_PEP_ID=MMETSP1388-20130828/50026_1 /ASSEMBLY_ACC=CAM_ASM_000864 /TAXON_ID=37098 /ORGANISM="Isochrysis sp, Strain CCMP1244" /LENGTH=135 /DNA_ID=CAMNT_0049445317 /DNA_START=35 /DNA_END=438 /DNA_ORIENTATION=+